MKPSFPPSHPLISSFTAVQSKTAVGLRWRACSLLLSVFLLQVGAHGGEGPKGADTNLAKLAGHWEGNAAIVVNWTRQRLLPVVLDIKSNGEVSGRVGDAHFVNGHIRTNRGPLARKLNLKTDYAIEGRLLGEIIQSEAIARRGVIMPLNFAHGDLRGGLHTTGTHIGGRRFMKLSATHLILRRAEIGGRKGT